MALDFPFEFRFGTATSAHQVEGGLDANNWAQWERSSPIEGEAPGELHRERVDHWRRFPEDLRLMEWLGADLYRFSVEWSRVEPRPGRFDDEALSRYRDWCRRLVEAGIAPMVTLHHFTEPLWVAERGGFESRRTVDEWRRFVERVVACLGDLVRHWVTVNEPVGYVVQGWLRGVWPPGRSDPATAARVLENLLLAHAAAYRAVHELDERHGRRSQVGLAHHIVVFRPRSAGNPLDRLAARLLDANYNRAVPDALATGRLRLTLPGLRYAARHDGLRGTQDFVGLNHYYPMAASWRPGRGRLGGLRVEFPGGEKDDLGCSLDPTSLTDAARSVAAYGLPVVVTEHGVCDGGDPDVRRRRQLAESLSCLGDAVAHGLDVRGYVHWSLMDNFEWTHGYRAEFGLFRVDPDSGARTPRSSAAFYRDVVAAHRRRHGDSRRDGDSQGGRGAGS